MFRHKMGLRNKLKPITGIFILLCGIMMIIFGLSKHFEYIKIEDLSTDSHNTGYKMLRINNETYKVPNNIRFLLPWPNNKTEDMVVHSNKINRTTALDLYREEVSTMEVDCRSRARMGSTGDGGWDVCLAGPYALKSSSCIVYSFGIGDNWSFDDDVAAEFECSIRSFDPTIHLDKHTRGDHIHFYPLGLSGKDGQIRFMDQIIPVKTFGTLLKQIGDKNNVIDYLKIDIEASEWEALPEMLREGSLRNVKQLGIELHADPLTISIKLINILHKLRKQGFRRWHFHWNPACTFIAHRGHFTACLEHYFININYLKVD